MQPSRRPHLLLHLSLPTATVIWVRNDRLCTPAYYLNPCPLRIYVGWSLQIHCFSVCIFPKDEVYSGGRLHLTLFRPHCAIFLLEEFLVQVVLHFRRADRPHCGFCSLGILVQVVLHFSVAHTEARKFCGAAFRPHFPKENHKFSIACCPLQTLDFLFYRANPRSGCTHHVQCSAS